MISSHFCRFVYLLICLCTCVYVNGLWKLFMQKWFYIIIFLYVHLYRLMKWVCINKYLPHNKYIWMIVQFQFYMHVHILLKISKVIYIYIFSCLWRHINFFKVNYICPNYIKYLCNISSWTFYSFTCFKINKLY